MIAAPVMDDRLLAAQLRWFVRLRWLAGLAVLAVGLADRFYFKWYQPDLSVSLTGLAILAYNLVLLVLLNRRRFGDLPAPVRIWTQVLPDLVCLALLLAWTGGVFSPLVGFFALHMVIASLLMTRGQAYAAALVGVALIVATMAVNRNLPTADGTSPGRLILGGLGLSLLVTVFLANQITDALRRQRTRLHHRNRRIRALLQDLRRQQERLVHHEKMVAMGRMAAGVAHEIANPLANMDSILQLAQRKPAQLTDEKIELLRQQVRRIEHTIRQMTEFAHPTDSRWESCVLSDVVDQAIDMLRFDRRRNQVEITRTYRRPGCITRMQSHAMQQALVNVLVNAIDAMEDVENPRLEVKVECSSTHCWVSVRDFGKGMPPEVRARLFEPFFTTKPVGKGTGLGLAITYNLIRQQSGSVEVHSEVGAGTTVILKLPHLAPVVELS